METTCRIELLGGLRICRDREVIERFRTQKTACLLGYLASPAAAGTDRSQAEDC